ncbi:phosphate regulon sensor histidine kinase PhoR [Candidatus Thiosymbion oneisti]|uniref:phosphate regulon sensor histidine kinase PhoR n=1 Tax=Candidatus Thiosymbion oneisti TaxID=589554 RepID=UPI000AE0184E|nr:phosphate regulon sensor histidine kinase PhoR [Candidatus Thiosymbion oneisti]
MLESLLFEVLFLLVSLAVALFLPWLGLDLALAVLLAILPYLGRNLYYLGHLTLLIRRRYRMVPPFPRGLWGVIYRSVAQHQQSGRKRRKRQVRFIRRFREAAISVPDALVILDRHRRIEWANPMAAELMNVHWPQDEGSYLTESLHHDLLGEFLVADEYLRPIELAPEHNRAITLSVRITPFGERKRQRLVVGRDITKVFHLNLIRRDFVANASHELRTPLTVISGFLENLMDSPRTPEHHRRPLQLMSSQAERMRSIVEDLLTLSRLEMEEAATQSEPVDVPETLRLILDEARLLDAGGHELTVDIAPDLLLKGNRLELRSALSNLVFNAIQHTPSESRIWITWREDEDGPLFAVKDDGEGIAREHVPRLTERFYRVDKARSRTSGGTGLGLAIVKHVLNRHDARLTIESEPGQGSTFTCRFPAGTGLKRSERHPCDLPAPMLLS